MLAFTIVESMPLNWRKVVVVVSLMIVIIGALTPDACADDAVTLDMAASATISMSHTGDQPFGCQHEEDCFCCAHIVPLSFFEIHPFVGIAKAEQQQCLSSIDRVPSVPYHPPKA